MQEADRVSKLRQRTPDAFDGEVMDEGEVYTVVDEVLEQQQQQQGQQQQQQGGGGMQP